MDFPNCTTENKNPLIPIKDRYARNSRAKVTLINRNQLPVKVIEIDGCVIKEEKCCDYLVIVPNSKLIYIELKGKRVDEALTQIEKTIEHIQPLPRIIGTPYCRCHEATVWWAVPTLRATMLSN